MTYAERSTGRKETRTHPQRPVAAREERGPDERRELELARVVRVRAEQQRGDGVREAPLRREAQEHHVAVDLRKTRSAGEFRRASVGDDDRLSRRRRKSPDAAGRAKSAKSGASVARQAATAVWRTSLARGDGASAG